LALRVAVASGEARLALDEAGGMFVKLGQMLSTRPDIYPLIPSAEDFAAELIHERMAPATWQQAAQDDSPVPCRCCAAPPATSITWPPSSKQAKPALG
jgi:hypothetical protein